jgi:hypothetical protein
MIGQNGQIYIQDPTQNGRMFYVNNTTEALIFLEGICHRGLNKSRKTLMNEMASLGHGYDDNNGVAFLRFMKDHVNLGLVKNGKHVPCDVTMEKFNKPEYGN